MPKMTIKDVAKLADVSPSAVSFVINNKKGVSPETRDKVLKIIEQVGYIPNPNSRRLIFNKSNNFVVLFKRSISPLEHYFYAEINNVILHECENYGYNLIFASIIVEDNKIEFPDVVKSYDVDGIIFYGDVDPIILRSLQKYAIPYIIIDSHSPNPDTLSVVADYSVAAYTAVKYLIQSGHENIAYIGNSFLAGFSAQTFSGYKKAMGESNLASDMQWIQLESQDEISAGYCMENILSCKNFPTAVFCSADIYAIGAIRAIKNAGLRVPDDISIISIDDIILSRYTDPMLTTIKIDKKEMGRIAINLLLKKIQDESVENAVIESDKLIVRGSTKII